MHRVTCNELLFVIKKQKEAIVDISCYSSLHLDIDTDGFFPSFLLKKELITSDGMCGNSETMVIMLDHRSTA